MPQPHHPLLGLTSQAALVAANVLATFEKLKASEEFALAHRELTQQPVATRNAIRNVMAGLESCGFVGKEAIESELQMVPKPLNTAIQMIWGYASNYARHVRDNEHDDPTELETALVVGLSALLAIYLLTNKSRDNMAADYYDSVHAEESDLPTLFRLYEGHFGADVPALTDMKAWHAINRDVFYKVLRVVTLTGESELVGSFKLVPLKHFVGPLLESGAVTSKSFLPEHIVKEGRAELLYIGDVCVSGAERTRYIFAGHVMMELKKRIAGSIAAGVTVLYTRPIRDEGLRQVLRFQFKPVERPGLRNLYRLDLQV